MKLRPLHDRVIVKRLEQETKTASGIVIPDNAAEKPDQGEVLAVGPGRKNDKGELIVPQVKTGDRVLFGKYSGQTVKVDGDELLVMKEDDLFAVVEGALHLVLEAVELGEEIAREEASVHGLVSRLRDRAAFAAVPMKPS